MQNKYLHDWIGLFHYEITKIDNSQVLMFLKVLFNLILITNFVNHALSWRE